MKIAHIITDEIRTAPSVYTTVLRSAEGSGPNDGWAMAPDSHGVIARKAGRAILIPWARIQVLELDESKPSPTRPASKAPAQESVS